MGRRKLVENDKLLSVARNVFIEKGFAASTREIARRAGVSEAVIYQRHPTKVHLFFAAMVPPPLNVENLLAAPADDRNVREHIEEFAVGTMEYFRELVPIFLSLMTHPSFDFEEFAKRHPDSLFDRLRMGLTGYLETQRELGNIGTENAGAAALALLSSLHCLAILERLGMHGGMFDDQIVRAVTRSFWTGLAPRSKTD